MPVTPLGVLLERLARGFAHDVTHDVTDVAIACSREYAPAVIVVVDCSYLCEEFGQR